MIKGQSSSNGTVSARQVAGLVAGIEHERGPRYAALAARIRLLVTDGRIPLDARLPAERDLAVALGVSRATVTAAYTQLRDAGWLRSRRGDGSYPSVPTTTAAGAWVPRAPESGVIDLTHAAPSAPPEVAACLAAALDALPRLLPGHGYFPDGLPDLRARIADRFTARGLPTSPEQVLVTAGALHALALAFSVTVRRGDRLLIEQPSYPNAIDTARSLGARLIAVAADGDSAARAHAAVDALAATRPVAAYLMPDVHNPTGASLGGVDRRRLARALERHQTVAVIDETMAELVYDDATPPPFASLSPHAITVGSLSKTCWGGLHIGWARADAETIRRMSLAAVRLRMSESLIDQLAACEVLDRMDGPTGLLARRRVELAGARDLLVGALRARLPQWQIPTPPAGLVLWCGLPARYSSALAIAADRHGLRLVAGPRFGVTAGALDDRLRIPFTLPPDELRRAADALADADSTVARAQRPSEQPATAVVV